MLTCQLVNPNKKVMSKRIYISPQSTEVLLHAAHILAASLKVDPSTDVDDSDKSNSREWGNNDAWEE